MPLIHASRRAGTFAAMLLLAAGGVIVRAQALSADDKAFFNKQMSALVKLEPHPIASDDLSKIFTGSFFKVDITVAGATSTIVAARLGNDLVQVTVPDTTAAMPELLKLVKPDFKITGDDGAKAFQGALDALYPIDTTFDKDDLKAKAFKHNGNEWTFIRGKFFDHFKGFVVTTKADGSISGIKYSLDIH